MSYYYQHAVDRTVSLLMNKQYPEREMVLEDDVIVLTKVDISCTNSPGEMDDSDEDSENELMQVYINESDLELLDDDDDDDEFIDDRPENELSKNSDDSGEEDKEYDSDLQNGNDSEGESEDESEPENGPDSNNGNGEENESNSDSDDEPIQSPRKKPKVDIFKEDSSSESSNEGNDNDRPSCNSDSLSESSNVENEADNVGNSTDPRGLNSFPGTSWMEKSNGESVQKKHVNKFGVFLLPKIDRKLTCLQYHGRIGMKGIKGHCCKMSKTKFCNLINKKRNIYGFTRLNLMYANARHLECRKAESALEKPVRKLLIHLIDQWFPLGIPQLLHLNRAVDLLECLKKKIGENKMPHSKYSNKFYALIPHQGDNQRRERFKTIEHCDNKIKYVNKMQSAIECLTEVEYMRRTNPLDHFIKEWLRIELHVLDTNEEAYKILHKAVENTQHAKSSRRFCVANIFRVDNMDRDTNGDFSTNIMHNHRYLFHFSFACNLPCILREGLVPAPQHIYSMNRFLGEGIYFWDAVANAGLNYKSLNTVYILVCRVALGKTQQVKQLYLDNGQSLNWEAGVDSIFCSGEKFSSSTDEEDDFKGAKIYCGQIGERKPEDHGYSLYNEYVVRNKEQVIVEYIIKLEKEDNGDE